MIKAISHEKTNEIEIRSLETKIKTKDVEINDLISKETELKSMLKGKEKYIESLNRNICKL